MHDKQENDSETNKIRQKTYQPHSHARWKYRSEKNCIGRITARENWTKSCAESDRSPDSFLMTRSLERILRELFYTCDIHEPCPSTWENKCYRKEHQETTCHIFPHIRINLYKDSGSLEEERKEEEWNNERSYDNIGPLITLACETTPENNWKQWKHTRSEDCENAWKERDENDSDHIYFRREESIGSSFFTRALS